MQVQKITKVLIANRGEIALRIIRSCRELDIQSVSIFSTIDANGVVVSTSEDGGEPVAVGFRAKKSNGKYKYYWLYRVKFGIPATNLATKGDSITFSTPTIEGTVLRRNKLDENSRHPWKAEVTDDGTSSMASVISGWYTSVYEPDFTIPSGN